MGYFLTDFDPPLPYRDLVFPFPGLKKGNYCLLGIIFFIKKSGNTVHYKIIHYFIMDHQTQKFTHNVINNTNDI